MNDETNVSKLSLVASQLPLFVYRRAIFQVEWLIATLIELRLLLTENKTSLVKKFTLVVDKTCFHCALRYQQNVLKQTKKQTPSEKVW